MLLRHTFKGKLHLQIQVKKLTLRMKTLFQSQDICFICNHKGLPLKQLILILYLTYHDLLFTLN